MDTEPPKQKTGNRHSPRSFLYLIVEETRQHVREVRQLAVEAKQTAVGMRHLARLMRERSRERRRLSTIERACHIPAP